MYARGTAAPNRSVVVAGGVLAVAGLAAALSLYARELTSFHWIVTAFGTVTIAFVAMQALPIRGLRMKRTGVNAEAIVLDLPVVAPLLVFGGAVGVTAAALALAIGYGAAALLRTAPAPTDLTRHGIMRVLAVLCFLPFADRLAQLWTIPAGYQTLAFCAAATVAAIAFVLCISAPLSALTYHISIRRVWIRVVSDPRTWIVGAGNILWASALREPVVHAHVPAILVMWLPVAAAARLLRTIDEQRSELHRLRLVRDAVQAMLGDRDPLPQINAILATLRVPAFDETVSVLSATAVRTEAWRTVTQLGPALTPAGDDLRRRILARLKFSGRPSTTLRDDYYIAYAFAARLADGELHGAMIVHRRNDRALSAEQMSQFTNAAFELAPLLRDMRTIVAAQSAATIDGLTGLFNRATTMDRLQNMLEDIGVSDRGAGLLLDIDHFKLINDHLG
ncbi:MAG: diguanylate cyclase, partial [Candidatus Eremiobacteraeota bacterium]|nr:diguanylate cyclase [Candidatus Eremiobacteraeota bacterium]